MEPITLISIKPSFNRTEYQMSTQSKNNIFTIIVIVSILLFIVAIIWKSNTNNNAEVVNVPLITVDTPIEKPKKDLSFLEEDNISYEEDSKNLEIYETQEENKKRLSSKLNMVMMYKTPEQVIKSVVYYQEKGETEKVDELVNFLLEHFPDYTIPDGVL